MREKIIKDFKSHASKEKAAVLQRFFKTGKGQYGEGDVFLGVVVPNIRKICTEYYKEISLTDIEYFLHSEIHEYRLFALLVLVKQFEKGNDTERSNIYKYYLKNTKYINNWDLVDLTAPNIVGRFLLNNDRNILYKLVKSKSIWEVRIAVLATFTFIREGDFVDILEISKLLLNHNHDLIHKAVGWMLREVGKRDIRSLRAFLDGNASIMPRTMLRYAIEKFDKEERLKYMLKS